MAGKKGIFITLEGPEGCGKTTHTQLLFKFLTTQGYKCVITREPGGTPLGEKIREILLNPSNKKISPVTETLLFEASRSALVENFIIPHIKRGFIVLSDRFSDATLVYQGYAGRQNIKTLERINRYATHGIGPNLTIVLDISAKEGLRRAKRAETRKKKLFKVDRMEKKSLYYHQAVRNGYLRLAKREGKRIKVIKTQPDIAKTQELIRRQVLRTLDARR